MDLNQPNNSPGRSNTFLMLAIIGLAVVLIAVIVVVVVAVRLRDGDRPVNMPPVSQGNGGLEGDIGSEGPSGSGPAGQAGQGPTPGEMNQAALDNYLASQPPLEVAIPEGVELDVVKTMTAEEQRQSGYPASPELRYKWVAVTDGLGNRTGITRIIISGQEQAPDVDSDGLTDSEESRLGTDPNNPDTDADDIPDGLEVNSFKTDPLSPNPYPDK